jgi:hypothetical protein
VQLSKNKNAAPEEPREIIIQFSARLAVLPTSTRITPHFQYALNIPFPDHNLRAMPHARNHDP